MLQPTERVFPSVCLVKCHLGHQTFENLLAQQISSEKDQGGWQHPVSNAIFRVSCVVLISSRGKPCLAFVKEKFQSPLLAHFLSELQSAKIAPKSLSFVRNEECDVFGRFSTLYFAPPSLTQYRLHKNFGTLKWGLLVLSNTSTCHPNTRLPVWLLLILPKSLKLCPNPKVVNNLPTNET